MAKPKISKKRFYLIRYVAPLSASFFSVVLKCVLYCKEDIYSFEVNTKYISSNVLKISVRSTSEIADISNTFDEIFLVFTEKK